MGFKKFGKWIKGAAKDVHKEVVKPVLNTVGGFAKGTLANVGQLQNNLVKATNPTSIFLYLGVGLAALYLLPRVLDTKAAESIARR